VVKESELDILYSKIKDKREDRNHSNPWHLHYLFDAASLSLMHHYYACAISSEFARLVAKLTCSVTGQSSMKTRNMSPTRLEHL
jgi:hypothetical protein